MSDNHLEFTSELELSLVRTLNKVELDSLLHHARLRPARLLILWALS